MKTNLAILSILAAVSLAAAKMPELYFNPPPRYEKLDQKNVYYMNPAIDI